MGEKKVQVPETFITGVYALLMALEDIELDENTRGMSKRLESQINAKMAAMKRREVFTAYKVAPDGSCEREERRREYLTEACIHQDWQTKKEIHL